MGNEIPNEPKIEESDQKIKPAGTILRLYDFINTCDKLNVISIVVVLISCGLMVAVGIDECKNCFAERKHQIPPKTFTIWKDNKSHLKHVMYILETMGYSETEGFTNWDLLWAHEYPFRALYNELKDLKPHQRVNHIPGIGYLTTKVDLATSGLSFIPPAFRLPSDSDKFVEYSGKHPGKKFLVKDNLHRNIRIKSVPEIDITANGSFVQEFMDNPLLVSGHMFDIGIYTVITSIDPLRVYIYNGDALLRFCPKKYYPFDPNNLDKYVVADAYRPTWEVPDLQYYYNELRFGMRESLNAYLRSLSLDPTVIWTQIDDIIASTILFNERRIANIVKRFKSKRNFFEMMRFDFLVDEDLKVFLLEANMSPNLSSVKFKPNELLYNQVLFNLFGLLGIGERVQGSSAYRSQNEKLLQSADKNIAILGVESSSKCKNSCESPQCDLCMPCMAASFKMELLEAHREHLDRGDFKRIFPPQMNPGDSFPADFSNYTSNDKLMYRWFREKCSMDVTWCH